MRTAERPRGERPGAGPDATRPTTAGKGDGGDERHPPEQRRRRRDHAKDDPDDLDREPSGHWRIAVVLVALVAVLGGLAYLVHQSGSQSFGTLTPTTLHPTAMEISVEFNGASGDQLSGTLLLPAASGQNVPGVVIVGDWGSVDRDGTRPVATVADPIYKDLAQTLLSHGIASLSYDPPGQGASTIPQGSSVSFNDLVGAASAAVTTIGQRVEIDPSRIVVVGAGWGGLVALQLAANDHQVARLVLLSTPGRPAVDDLSDQLLANAISPAEGQLEIQQLHDAVATLEASGKLPGAADLETALRPVLPQSDATYLKALFSIDPATLAAKVHAPALIVRGGQDTAVTATDTQILEAALGYPSQVYVAPDAGPTLTDVTKTVTTAPLPIPAAPTTTSANMVTMRPSNVVLTPSRDQQALDAIAQWAVGSTPSAGAAAPSANASGTASGMPSNAGISSKTSTTLLPFGGPMNHDPGAP